MKPLWWISFADDDKSRGVAIIEAASFGEALREAWRREINPGGEAFGVAIPFAYREIARSYMNRLIPREEAEHIFGPAADLTRPEYDALFGDVN